MCARETCVARCSAARRPRPPPDEQRSSPSHVSIFTAPHRTARPPHRRAPLHRARVHHPSRAYNTQTTRARIQDPTPTLAPPPRAPTHPGSATAMPRTLACTRRAPDSTDRGPVPRYPGLLRSPVTCAFRRGAACKNLKDQFHSLRRYVCVRGRASSIERGTPGGCARSTRGARTRP